MDKQIIPIEDYSPNHELRKIKAMQEETAKICDYCDGTGEVINEAKISSRSIDIPYKYCPICHGTGVA